MQDWGMDVMKVGQSLGVGSIGIFQDTIAVRVEKTDSVTCTITENGPVYSSILTKYFGWKTAVDTIDVESEISIHAGTRLTRELLHTSRDIDKFCTGLVKDDKAELTRKEPSSNAVGYLATYGPQSLNKDNLGIAVFFSSEAFNGFTEDKFSHIVKVKSAGGQLEYYFVAVWEGETDGIKTKDAFVFYLESVAKRLTNPISISFP
jgi:hypothetical protein